MKLNDYISLYRSLGLAMFPLVHNAKNPAVESWKKYQTTPPSPSETDKWFSDEGKFNVGILCGPVSGNLVVLDFDDPAIYDKFFNLPEIEAATLVVKTPRGRHVYLRSPKPILSFKIPQIKLDVQSTGKYVVAPPSIVGKEYEFVNPTVNKIIEVPNIEETIWKAAREKFKVETPRDYAREFRGSIARKYVGPNPPCIQEIAKGVLKGFRNEATVRLASYYLTFRGITSKSALKELLLWNKWNDPPLPVDDIRKIVDNVAKVGYRYGCKSMQAFCDHEHCPLVPSQSTKEQGESQDDKLKQLYVPFLELSDGRLAEECFADEKAFFIVWNPEKNDVERDEKGEPKRFDFLNDKDILYEPVVNDDIKAELVLLPSGVETYESDEKLFAEVEQFLDYWHEELDRVERCLDVLYVFLTHIADIVPQIPFRRSIGAFGRGKTAFIDTIWAVSYRPLSLSGCDSDASIARTLELWRGTSKIDEADFSNSDLYSFIVKMLNSAFDRRAGYYKRAYADDPKKFLHYYVYGPKILATRERWRDTALESRCLTKFAEENVSPRPLYRWKNFIAQAQTIRNKLLLWRLRNYQKLRLQIDAQIEDPNIADRVYPERKSTARSRVMQIVLPLSFVGFDKNLKDAIEQHEEVIDALDEETQLLEQIAAGIKCLMEVDEVDEVVGHKGGTPQQPTGMIKMPLKDLAAHMVGLEPTDPAERKEFVAERTQLSRQISKLLKKKPGFSIKMGAKGYKVLKVSRKKLKSFFTRHLKVDETPTPPNADNLDNLDNPAEGPKIERISGAMRVRLTTRERAAISLALKDLEEIKQRHNGRTRGGRVCGYSYGEDDIKAVERAKQHLAEIENGVEIYLDEALYWTDPVKVVVEASIHEVCHQEGLNEEETEIATAVLLDSQQVTDTVEKKIRRAFGGAMAWMWIKCPKHKRDVGWAECLRCTDAEKHPTCPDFAIRSRSTQRKYTPGVYHVTELVTPRQSYFNRKFETAKAWTDSPAFMRFFMGKAFHKFYQEAFAPHEVEIYVARDFGNFKVTGSTDVVAGGMLRELKTHGDLGRVTRWGPSPEHIWQAQAYYSLLKVTQPELARDVKKIKILYGGLTRADTWLEFPVPLDDITDDIRARAKVLHEALKANEPPTQYPCPEWLCRVRKHECFPICKGGKPALSPRKKHTGPMKIYIKEDVQRTRGGKNPVWCIKFEESDGNFWIKFKDGKKPWAERGILFVDWLPTLDQVIEIIKFAVRYNHGVDLKIVTAVLEAAKEGKK